MQFSTRVSPSNRQAERQAAAAQAVMLRVARRPRLLRRRANWLLVSGAIMVSLVVLMALVGAIHPPQDPTVMHPAERGQGPSQRYWLGTDQYGRDIFSRVLSAAAVALLVGVGSSALGVAIGGPLGATAGFVRGWSDEAIMRVMDALLAFPATLLAIALAGMLGPGLTNTILAIGVAYVPVFARLARAAVIGQLEADYVDAAWATGCTPARVLWVHILPNSLAPLIVQVTVAFGSAILAEAGLSYLGLGVQPPDASWGQMLHDAGSYLSVAPWLAVFPGLAIVFAVIGANFLGDGLNAYLDPNRRQRG